MNSRRFIFPCNLKVRRTNSGLCGQSSACRGTRIVLYILLALAGWMGAFARPQQTPAFPEPSPIPTPEEPDDSEFTFVRAVYTGLGPWDYFKAWYTDWPKSDRQFILGVRRLTNIRISEQTRTLELTDPDLFRYPFLYSVECGHWNLTDSEINALREYLKRGGFLFCDDFWGSEEWDNFQQTMARILPGAGISELPMNHPIFHCYYDIGQVIQIPNVGNALYENQTHEQDGFVPHCRGILNDEGRLMVVINWNTDLGDAWEWADLPGYPAKYSTYAYKMGINAIIYAMTH